MTEKKVLDFKAPRLKQFGDENANQLEEIEAGERVGVTRRRKPSYTTTRHLTSQQWPAADWLVLGHRDKPGPLVKIKIECVFPISHGAGAICVHHKDGEHCADYQNKRRRRRSIDGCQAGQSAEYNQQSDRQARDARPSTQTEQLPTTTVLLRHCNGAHGAEQSSFDVQIPGIEIAAASYRSDLHYALLDVCDPRRIGL
jgi:hypothetical protein